MAMFTLPQMISRLTKGFVKFTGRKPDGLEKIKIKQEALERIKQQDKVVDMEGNVLDVTKPIIGGKQEGLERVAKTLEANQKIKLNTFKNLDDNKKLNADEIEELEVELGNVNDPDGPDLYEAYPEFDGTAGSAKKILKDSVEYEQSMFEQYKAGKLDPTPKPVGSLDREIKESYNQAVREGRLQNIRLKDGRRIESEDDFREYIDELNEDNNFASGGRVPLAGGGGGFAFKLAKIYRQSKQYKDFIEKLFVKTSNEIRRGEGAFKNLSVNEKIKLHDDLTKEVTNYQKTGELRESAHQYFGFNPEQQYADSLLQKQLKMTPEEELRQEFPRITDEMVSNILTDTNQQRIAEVKATMKEALKMQEKGMGTDEILQIFEKTPRTKNASGGIARLLGE